MYDSMGMGLYSPWYGDRGESFPCPFEDIASLHFPESLSQALRWSEFLVISNGTYWRALDRVLSYFLTDIEITDIGDDEADEWYEFLHDDFNVRRQLHTVGMDLMVYGNSFISVLPPFRRYLYCGKCRLELPLSEIHTSEQFRARWENFEFYADCPRCHYSGRWPHVDRHGTQRDKVHLKRWSPHDIEILWDYYSDDCAYIWKIPTDYRAKIRNGSWFHLERCPWEVVQAIKNDNHIRFDRDVIYHMKEEAPAGIRNRGWGISRVLSNFRQAWYVQVLHRYNEAIGLDYIIPFRVITPAPGDKQAGTDVMLHMNAADAGAQIRRMIRQRRRDPAGWYTLPFAVQYQTLGGEARSLAPVDLLNQGMETLLNAIGVPVELFRGSLTLQTAPVSLRVFESMWTTLPHALNGFLRFAIGAISRIMNWEEPGIKLSAVTTADDVSLLQLKLQLMTGGQVSPSTGLKLIGLNHRDEVKRTLEDEQYEAEQRTKMQENMESAAQMDQAVTQGAQGAQGQPGQAQGGQAQAGGGQAAPPGSAPQGAQAPPGMQGQSVSGMFQFGENEPIKPDELEQRTSYAAQILMTYPPSQRYSELHKLEKVNPSAHAIVTKKLEKIRQEAASQGKSQVLTQQFGVPH